MAIVSRATLKRDGFETMEPMMGVMEDSGQLRLPTIIA